MNRKLSAIYEMDAESIDKIKSVETCIKDKKSLFYKELLEFLSGRRQRSYLENGFIRAALKYFKDFYK